MANQVSSTPAQELDRQRWSEALGDYRLKRAASDAIPVDGDGADEAVDEYCRAMDHLIEHVPAPDLPAVITKLELMTERFEGFEQPVITTTAVMNDLRTLAVRAAGTSLIALLHARYEAIWDAHDKLDVAQPAKFALDHQDHAKWRLYYSCERGMRELADESDLVQQLILRQVPSTDEEATIQALHAHLIFDAGENLKQADRKALEIALDNILDFHVGEGRADMERLGRQFSTASMHCWSRRRHREGLTDSDIGLNEAA